MKTLFLLLVVSLAATNLGAGPAEAPANALIVFAYPKSVPTPTQPVTVVVKFIVDSSNRTRDIVVAQSNDRRFEAAARNAIATWTTPHRSADVSSSIRLKATIRLTPDRRMAASIEND